MSIRDWSSDVCSSDLHRAHETREAELHAGVRVRIVEWIRSAEGEMKQRRRLVKTTDGRALLSDLLPRGLSFDIDRKRGVYGKSVSVRVALGGHRSIKKKTLIYLKIFLLLFILS